MIKLMMAGLALIAGALAACTLTGSGTSSEALRADLAARLVETQASQAAALALWDRVIFGEEVSCQDAIPVPGPISLTTRDRAAHPSAATVETRLNEAIRFVQESSDLWNIECADPQAIVPLEMARAGRASALAASDPLAEAARLLAAW